MKQYKCKAQYASQYQPIKWNEKATYINAKLELLASPRQNAYFFNITPSAFDLNYNACVFALITIFVSVIAVKTCIFKTKSKMLKFILFLVIINRQ